jgi:L-threonylcarbamoyladenylate synthase
MTLPGPAGRPARIADLASAADDEVAAVAAAIREGKVVALLTETLWGLSGDPFSPTVMARIAALKGRSPARGFLCLAPSAGSVAALGAEVDDALRAALERLWPSPVTVVLASGHPLAASGGLPTVAVRVPSSVPLRRLLRETGPLASTSANLEGMAPASTADEIEALFGPGIAWIVGGDCPPDARPSSLVDASVWPPRLLRRGAGDEEAGQFIRALGGYPESL